MTNIVGPETITILRSRDRPTAKCIREHEGKTVVESSSTAFQFDCKTVRVTCLAELADVLARAEYDPSTVVIRGELADGLEPENLRRRNVNFNASARKWCLIDIDDLKLPGKFSDYQAHREKIARYAIKQLPDSFHGVDCWFQFSSSMGIKVDKIRLHLWFWLSRRVSDQEMKAWLCEHPVDLRLYQQVHMHFIARPILLDGISDPFPNRSGFYRAGGGVEEVNVPDDLKDRARQIAISHRPRTNRNGIVEPHEIVRDPGTGLAIDGREKLLFLLSNQVTSELVQESNDANSITEEMITERLWQLFESEADLSDGKWTIEDAREKAKARYQELSDGTYSFTSRADTTTLYPCEKPYHKLEPVPQEEGTKQLEETINQFFSELGDRGAPRNLVRVTMGAGKTKTTIDRLKDYLRTQSGIVVEIYVPRHEIIDEYVDKLEADGGVNAKVVHVFPRTGGTPDSETGAYPFEPTCNRYLYVRDLEAKGHSVFQTACFRPHEGDQCVHYNSCKYMEQFRRSWETNHSGNLIRIYPHSTLGNPRNEVEEDASPNLLIIDEAFAGSIVDTDRRINPDDVRRYLRTGTHRRLGSTIVDCLVDGEPLLEELRQDGIGRADLEEIDLTTIAPGVEFEREQSNSRELPSAKLFYNLQSVIRILSEELRLEDRNQVERLVYDPREHEIVLCILKDHRISDDVPLLLLDATADESLTERLVGPVSTTRIDIEQRAYVTQVYDRTASNTWWDDSSHPERIDELVGALNSWAKFGETPLCISHKKLANKLRGRTDIHENVSVDHFVALRGGNDYKDCSVVFITGRHQPPPWSFDLQARALHWDDEESLVHDEGGRIVSDNERLPLELRGFTQMERNERPQSGVYVNAFSDPRIETLHAQEREAETAQALARIRMVHSSYRKQAFLLGNLPVEMGIDRLVTSNEMMPDRLEKELLTKGNIPLTAKGIVKMRPDLTTSEDAARKMLERSRVRDGRAIFGGSSNGLEGATFVLTFRAGDIYQTDQRHLFIADMSEATRSYQSGGFDGEILKAFLENGDETTGGQGWGQIEITGLDWHYQ